MNGPMTAKQVAEEIKRRKSKEHEFAYESLRSKCRTAISSMIRNVEFGVEVPLVDDELRALVDITEELRDLGYKFRYIEVQDSNGERKEVKLYISVFHEAK